MGDIIPTYRGFNVAPRDLEEVIYSQPAVGEAVVIGLLHPCGAGDMVIAWASAKAGKSISPGELREHCEAAGLPAWQTPEAFCISSEPLPTNGSKLNRKAMQEASYTRRALVNWLRAAAESKEADMSPAMLPENETRAT